jgi:hypothetical protein
MLIFKPDTIVKVSKTEPAVSFTKSGVVQVNLLALRKIKNVRCLYFIHNPEDNTTYLIPPSDGFLFTVLNDNKGLLYRNAELSKQVRLQNGTSLDTTLRLILGDPVELTVCEDLEKECYPLFKTSKP